MTAPILPGLVLRAQAALETLLDAALHAGEIALRDFHTGEKTSAPVAFKRGNSPVTGADLAVNAFLLERLGAAFPQAGWLSEETADDPTRLDRAELLVIDPIDGTRAYMSGDPRWAVSIALVSEGRPIAGVVHAPALGQTYAAAHGCGATRDGFRLGGTEAAPQERPVAGGPRAMIAALTAQSGVEWEVVARIPSLALRLAQVASGELMLAFASANSHDWDIAAADIVLREAGAALIDEGGRGLDYNRRETRHGSLAGLGAALPSASREAALAVLRQTRW